jgi:1,4-dihydroxy-2-naphthoate octaprenyltransferase
MSTENPAAKMPPLWIIKMRAPFFTVDIVPVLLGTALAWAREGKFNLWYFLLTLVGTVFINAGTNMTNDYFDHKWGSDEVNKEFINPFTGGSRVIQMGLVKPKEMLWQGIGFFIAASVIGLILAFTRGWGVLWLGLIGVFSGYFYTAPPVRLVRTGLGELVVGMCLGPLTVLGAYYVQVQEMSWEPVVASLPVGFLVALILWINEFQDMPADAQVGKNHLIVRIGRKAGATAFGLLLAATYLSIILGVLFAGVTPWALIALAISPLALKAYRIAREHYDHPQELVPANVLTIRAHLLTGLLLSVGYVAQGIIGLL